MMNWKRTISLLLCMAMLLGNFPVVSFAAETDGLCEHHTEHLECGYVEGESACGYVCEICAQTTEETTEPAATEETKPVCTGLADCAAENHNEGCEKAAADAKAAEEEAARKAAEEKAAADKAAADAVAALIAALPALVDIQAKPYEEQGGDYTQVNAAYDAWKALTDEQKALLPYGQEFFDPYLLYFSGQTQEIAIYSGSCGANLQWSFDDTTGVLTISGTGAMYDYFYSSYPGPVVPWENYKKQVTAIEIGEGITYIGDFAFNRCSSVEEVTIPASVTSIGTGIFFFCGGLERINVASGNTAFASVDGVLFSANKATLVAFPASKSDTSYTIPNTVTTVADFAFYRCSNLTAIQFGTNVTTIGDSAFCDCSGLTAVTVPSTVTSLGSSAFSGCSSLVSATVPGSIGALPFHAFYDCSSLKNVTLGQGLTAIGPYAFYNCRSLQSIVIPEGPTEIGKEAFRECKSLKLIVIPSSVTDIKDGAFYDCDKLNHVLCTGAVPNIGDSNNAVKYDATKHSGVAGTEAVLNSDGTVTCSLCALTAVSISAAPTKKYYARNENLDVTGGKLQLTYGSGTNKTVDITAAMVTGFDSTSLGTKTLTVSYEGKTATFTVTVAVPVDETTFPDANFRNIIATDTQQVPGASDGWLTAAELANVTSLSIHGYGDKAIANLTGIEHFTNLTSLYCYGNKLTRLDVSKNTKLKRLYCNLNALTELDVSQNTALEELDCNSNQLTALDVSKNTALYDLACENNLLSTLDVSNNTLLKILFCQENQLTVLDISNNTALEDLNCRDNRLEALDTGKNTKLKSLDCSKNCLTSLDFNNNYKSLSSVCTGNAYTITVTDNQFDLTKLPGNFDVSKASSWSGGEVNGNILTVTKNKVTYSYKVHNGTPVGNDGYQDVKYVTFVLNVQGFVCTHENMTAGTCQAPAKCASCGYEGELDPDNHPLMNNICSLCGYTSGMATVTANGVTAAYNTLEDAILAANNAESALIQLRKEPICKGDAIFTGNVTLDMNGFDLYLGGGLNEERIYVKEGASLRLISSAASRIYGRKDWGLIETGGYLYIGESVSVENTYSTHAENIAIEVTASGTAEIDGTTEKINNEGTLKANGTISKIFNQGGTVTMTGGAVGYENVQYPIQNSYNGTTTISGGTITGSIGIYSNAGNITISGGTINTKLMVGLDEITDPGTTYYGSIKLTGGTFPNGITSLVSYGLDMDAPTLADLLGEGYAYSVDGLGVTLSEGQTSIAGSVTVVKASALPRISGIAVTQAPTKTSYNLGDSLKLTGGKITVTYSNGATKTVDMTAGMVTGFDNTTLGTQTLTVTYEGETATFTVTVTCNHNYNQKTVTEAYLKSEATCTAPATYYYSCKCGAIGTETFEDGTAAGHDRDADHKCKVCGHIGGYCGQRVNWEFNETTGTLTISGTGVIDDYEVIINSNTCTAPWNNAYKTLIREVSIGSGITSIGNNAFRGCENVEKVSLPNSLQTIGDYVFFSCSSLGEIALPDGVTSMGEMAFGYCSSLREVIIPKNVTTIADGTFSDCSNLKKIVIPNGVTSIGNHAFNLCKGLQEINIPEGVTSIGYGAFRYCTSLREITIPARVTSINAYTFSSCSNLRNINLPNGVTSIGNAAFSGCSRLTEIAIPADVTIIESDVFAGCKGLKEIILPTGVTSIGIRAFSGCTGLKEITIPNGVTSIGNEAFHNCNSLTDVYYAGDSDAWSALGEHRPIGESLYTHYECTNGSGHWTPKTVNVTCETDGYTCEACSCDPSYERNKQITETASGHTYDQEKVHKDYLVSAATCQSAAVYKKSCSVCNAASETETFTYGNLTDHNRDENHKCGTCGHIGGYCGDPNVNGGKNVSWTLDKTTGKMTISGSGAMKNYTLNTYTNLPGTPWLNKYSTDIKTVEVQNGVTTIGDYLFYYCYRVATVNLPEGITYIGEYAFAGTDLTSIELSDGLLTIGRFAFASTELTSITLPESVTTVKQYAFGDCAKLTEIIMPSTLTEIQDKVFQGCTALEKVVLPEGITKIWDSLFMNCSSLTEVAIPRSVTGVNQNAFKNCTALADVYYAGDSNAWIALGDNRPVGENLRVHYECTNSESHWAPKTVDATCTEDGYTAEVCKCAMPYERNKVVDPATGEHVFAEVVKAEYLVSAATCTSAAVYKKSCSVCGAAGTETFTSGTPDYRKHNFVEDVCACGTVKISETTFPDANFRAYITSQTYGQDNVLTSAELSNVKTINVNSKGIKDLTGIEYFTALTALSCGFNQQLTELDVSKNVALTELDCYFNQLTELDVSKNVALTYLNCAYSQLTELDVSKNVALTVLRCEFNQLTGLDVSKNVALTELYCYSNKRTVTATQNRFDLSNLAADGFDISKASNWSGGTVDGNILTTTAETVTYTYDLGRNKTETFTLKIDRLCEHNFVEKVDGQYLVSEATCTAQAEYYKSCSACGGKGTETFKHGNLNATNHAGGTEIRDAKVATCTVDGYTGDTYCLGCDTKIADGETIGAPGHKMGDWVTVNAATCSAKGSERRDCDNCDHFETRETEKLVHNYETVVTAPNCVDKGFTTHTCSACGDSYVDTHVDELGHELGEWTVVTEPAPGADGEERRTCSRCDHFESRPVQYQGNILKLEGEDLLSQSVVYINGLPYAVKGEGENRYVELSIEGDFYMVTYTYHVGDASDVHTQYPTGMKVYKVSGGKITYIPELDNLLQYSGSSIRITGKKGIRMITSLTKDTKAALTGNGLAGYKLLEYGTALCFASEVAGDGDLVLGKSYTRSNYAYKRGVADPVFATSGNLTQYTNVLVGFSLNQCKDDIAMRPYIILEDANGEQVTLYGGTIYRSIGYIAYQNRNVFRPKTASYNYVWEIIHHVYGDKYDADYKG